MLAPLAMEHINFLPHVPQSAPRQHSVGHQLDFWVSTALLLRVARPYGTWAAQGTLRAPPTRPSKGGGRGSAGHEQLRVTAPSLRPQRGPATRATIHLHDHPWMLGTRRGGGVR